MPEPALCPICSKRRLERFCPAKGERICAICCGTEREVTLDCPPDCAYLIKAHRYEREHRRPLAEDQIPFPKVEFSPNLIYERQTVVLGLVGAILDFAAAHAELADGDILSATSALAETYSTLISGIYYQKPPDSLVASGVYAAMEDSLQNIKQQEQDRGQAAVKDQEVFHLLVFLTRLNRTRTNQRPRARIFLDFLRSQLPPDQTRPAEASRIIIP